MTETQKMWERVRDWRAGGKSAEEYAEGREFKASTLRYRASHLLRRVMSSETAAHAREAPVRMVPVISRPPPANHRTALVQAIHCRARASPAPILGGPLFNRVVNYVELQVRAAGTLGARFRLEEAAFKNMNR